MKVELRCGCGAAITITETTDDDREQNTIWASEWQESHKLCQAAWADAIMRGKQSVVPSQTVVEQIERFQTAVELSAGRTTLVGSDRYKDVPIADARVGDPIYITPTGEMIARQRH